MPSSLTIDASDVQANLQRTASGAVNRFFMFTRNRLNPIAASAKAQWPRHTGKSADSITVVSGRDGADIYSAVSASPAKSGWPAYKITWSRYSQAARDKIIEEAGSVEAGRAKTPEAADSIRAHFRARKMRMIKARFGVVPPLGMEGKQPWNKLVQRPAYAATGALVRALQDDLVLLARGGR